MKKTFSFLEKYRSIFLPFMISALCGIISVFRGQDTNGDVWNYHLYNAYAWLNGRLGYDIGPAGAHSYFNPYLDVFSYYIIFHTKPILAAFIFGSLQGLIAFPILYICKFFIKNKKTSFFMTLVCCLTSTFFIGELGSSMHDNIIAIPILFSFYFIIKYIYNKNINYAILSGLLCGLSTGLKLTAALYVPVFFLLIIINGRKKVYSSFSFFLSSFISLISTSGFWYYQLYSIYKNPVFPFFNNIFHSPYASLDKNATRDMMFFHFHGLEKIIYPFYFADHIDRVVTASNDKTVVVYTTLFCFVFSFLYFSTRILKYGFKGLLNRKLNILLSFFFFSFYIWQYVFGVYRYFIPTELICPLILYILIKEILSMQLIVPKNISFIACTVTSILMSINFLKGIPDWGRSSYISPYIDGQVPQEVKNADILFNANFFSAWIIPIIKPTGHVIQINRGLFDFGTKKYWDLYYDYLPKNAKPKQFVLFNDLNDKFVNEWVKNKFKEYYNLKINFSICKNFPVRLSAYNSTITYCPVISENDTTSK